MGVQHLSVKNITRATTAWAASPVGLLIRVEVLVTASCALLATLVFLGSGRRTSRSAAFRFVVWLALMLSYPAVSYTIGLMQSGSFRNDMVVVWACFLLGCADGIAACSVDGSDQQARTMISQATQVLYVMLLLLSYLGSLKPQLKMILSLLWLLNVAKLGLRLWSLLAAGRDRVLTADNWLISKYMAHEKVTDGLHRYVLTGDHGKNVQYQYNGDGEYKLQISDNEIVTVEKAWEKNEHDDGNQLSNDGKLKDLLLSFALFKLLRQRLRGKQPPLHEPPGDIKALVFVRRGLAGGDECDDYERIFRVIEVELGFLYDFYYARYPSPKQTLIPETAMFLAAAMLSISALFSTALLHHHSPGRGKASIDFTTTSLDIWLARLVITLFLVLEISQYLSLVLSDWHRVKMLCRYIRHRPWWHRRRRPILETVIWLTCRATLTRSYWSNSVGQYSLLHACLHNHTTWLPAVHRWITTSAAVTRRSLPVAVRRQIHRLLRSEWLSNIKYGDRILQKYNLLQQFDWSTSRYEFGAMGSILIWHIATAICDVELSKLSSPAEIAECREAATVLSNYCAYLLLQAPELVTDEVHEERLLMEAVQERIQSYFRRQGCRRSKANAMFAGLRDFVRNDNEANVTGEAILADGVRLGKLLLSGILKDEVARWDLLAEMWVELLLTVAPSENVTGHVKFLATGGELITHLWALLTYCGIIKRPPKPNYASR
uniref:DUF4220 domain-containing protein n=1 Tax=Leersia perrieri TaxID=77586 RepID=A0A0D9XXJ6_9ORYZ